MKYRFYYAGIRVKNLRRSLEFYTKALGMRVVHQGTMSHGATPAVPPDKSEGTEVYVKDPDGIWIELLD